MAKLHWNFANYFANGEIYANSEVWLFAPELR